MIVQLPYLKPTESRHHRVPKLKETYRKPTNIAEPVGLTIIRYATLLFSLGFGFYAVFSATVLGIGGAGNPDYRAPQTESYLSLFFVVTAVLSFLDFVVLRIRPRRSLYSFQIGFWLFLLSSYGLLIFDSLFIGGSPMPTVLIEIWLIPVAYSLVCIVYFQMARMKDYFHV